MPNRLTEPLKNRLAAFGPAIVVGFVLGVLALVVFADIAEDVLSQETQQVDDAVLLWLRQAHSPILNVLALVTSAFGSEILLAVLILALAYLAWTRQWTPAAALAVVTAGAQLLNYVLKELFHRTRPAPVDALTTAQGFSFPSGHAMVSAAFYGFLAYLAWRALRGWRRTVMTILLLALIALIGLSRLYLGVHYLSDVVAGYIAGFIWTDAVVLGDTLRRRGRHGADATPPLPHRGEGWGEGARAPSVRR